MKINTIDRILIIFGVILIMLYGCTKDEKVNTEIQYHDKIMPLAEGNYWVYEDSIFVNGSHTHTEHSKIAITGSSTISHQGKKIIVYYWNWFEMPEDKPQIRKSLVRNEPEGLFYYGQKIGSTYSNISKTLFIKYPVDEGEEWAYKSGVIIKCVSSAKEFETKAGVFNVYKHKVVNPTAMGDMLAFTPETVANTRGETIQYLYYAPEIGYIGMKNIQNGEVILKRSLLEFSVEKDKELSKGMGCILSS